MKVHVLLAVMLLSSFCYHTYGQQIDWQLHAKSYCNHPAFKNSEEELKYLERVSHTDDIRAEINNKIWDWDKITPQIDEKTVYVLDDVNLFDDLEFFQDKYGILINQKLFDFDEKFNVQGKKNIAQFVNNAKTDTFAFIKLKKFGFPEYMTIKYIMLVVNLKYFEVDEELRLSRVPQFVSRRFYVPILESDFYEEIKNPRFYTRTLKDGERVMPLYVAKDTYTRDGKIFCRKGTIIGYLIN